MMNQHTGGSDFTVPPRSYPDPPWSDEEFNRLFEAGQVTEIRPAVEPDKAGILLEGVTLTVREMAHLLINDLTPAIWTLWLLQKQSDLPPSLREKLRNVQINLETAAEHISKFQQVNHVAIQETPFGPSLDLERSVNPYQ